MGKLKEIYDQEWLLFTTPARGNLLSYSDCFAYWTKILREKCCNIFVWKGLPFPQHELEFLLIMKGYAGLAHVKKSENKYDAVKASMFGVTNYPDIFSNAIWTTPINFGYFKINESGVIINNTATRLPLSSLIVKYAHMLAHADITIQSLMINDRANNIFKATNTKLKEAVSEWHNALVDGKTIALLDSETFESLADKDSLSIQTITTAKNVNVLDYKELQERYIQEFYRDIGIRQVVEKKERLIDSEVKTGFSEVMFNISDMLKQRQDGCDNIRKIFKEDVEVDINPELKIATTQNGNVHVEGGEQSETS